LAELELEEAVDGLRMVGIRKQESMPAVRRRQSPAVESECRLIRVDRASGERGLLREDREMHPILVLSDDDAVGSTRGDALRGTAPSRAGRADNNHRKPIALLACPRRRINPTTR